MLRGNKKAEEETPRGDFRASSSEFLLNTGDEPKQRKVSGTRDGARNDTAITRLSKSLLVPTVPSKAVGRQLSRKK